MEVGSRVDQKCPKRRNDPYRLLEETPIDPEISIGDITEGVHRHTV